MLSHCFDSLYKHMCGQAHVANAVVTSILQASQVLSTVLWTQSWRTSHCRRTNGSTQCGNPTQHIYSSTMVLDYNCPVVLNFSAKQLDAVGRSSMPSTKAILEFASLPVTNDCQWWHGSICYYLHWIFCHTNIVIRFVLLVRKMYFCGMRAIKVHTLACGKSAKSVIS